MPYLSSYFRQPYLPRPATSSPSPVRDDSESPKEEDSVGAYMGCREPISRSKTYAKYRQDVPDRDAIEKAMKWTLNKTSNIQAQLKSQEAKLRDLEAGIQMRLQQLETKFDKKASDTNYYLALHGDAILGVSSIFTRTLFLLNIFDCRVRELSTAYWFAALWSLCKRPWRSV